MVEVVWPVDLDQSARGCSSHCAFVLLRKTGDEMMTPVSMGKQDAGFEITSPLDAGHAEEKEVKAWRC